MRFLWHWIPTFAACLVLFVWGLVLSAQIQREERRRRRPAADPTSISAEV